MAVINAPLGSSRLKDAWGERQLEAGTTFVMIDALFDDDNESWCVISFWGAGSEEVDALGDKCFIDVLDGFVAIWVVVVVEDMVLFGSFYFRSYITMI